MKRRFFLSLVLFSNINCFCQTAQDYFIMGIAKANVQDYHGAINDYNKAIEIDSNSAATYNNRGLAKASDVTI